MSTKVSGSEAIRLGIADLMKSDPKVLTYGLGVNDPGRVFGTTEGLLEEFGPERVFETPTSELALTGVGVGLALGGYKVIHSHQRMDFALLAMDQLVNSAAKWRFMFGDQFQVPYLVRMIIGRGWGQGPTHSQNFESWLAHVPGLRVIVPATPQDMFNSIIALKDSIDPIIVIEHRWLHGVTGELTRDPNLITFNLDPLIHATSEKPLLRIVTWGMATYDSLAAQSKLSSIGVSSEVLQIRELDDVALDQAATLEDSTKGVLVVSGSWGNASFVDSIISRIARVPNREVALDRVTHPNHSEPSALSHLDGYHVSDWRIANSALELLERGERFQKSPPTDQPSGYNFGPF